MPRTASSIGRVGGTPASFGSSRSFAAKAPGKMSMISGGPERGSSGSFAGKGRETGFTFANAIRTAAEKSTVIGGVQRSEGLVKIPNNAPSNLGAYAEFGSPRTLRTGENVANTTSSPSLKRASSEQSVPARIRSRFTAVDSASLSSVGRRGASRELNQKTRNSADSNVRFSGRESVRIVTLPRGSEIQTRAEVTPQLPRRDVTVLRDIPAERIRRAFAGVENQRSNMRKGAENSASSSRTSEQLKPDQRQLRRNSRLVNGTSPSIMNRAFPHTRPFRSTETPTQYDFNGGRARYTTRDRIRVALNNTPRSRETENLTQTQPDSVRIVDNPIQVAPEYSRFATANPDKKASVITAKEKIAGTSTESQVARIKAELATASQTADNQISSPHAIIEVLATPVISDKEKQALKVLPGRLPKGSGKEWSRAQIKKIRQQLGLPNADESVDKAFADGQPYDGKEKEKIEAIIQKKKDIRTQAWKRKIQGVIGYNFYQVQSYVASRLSNTHYDVLDIAAWGAMEDSKNRKKNRVQPVTANIVGQTQQLEIGRVNPAVETILPAAAPALESNTQFLRRLVTVSQPEVAIQTKTIVNARTNVSEQQNRALISLTALRQPSIAEQPAVQSNAQIVSSVGQSTENEQLALTRTSILDSSAAPNEEAVPYTEDNKARAKRREQGRLGILNAERTEDGKVTGPAIVSAAEKFTEDSKSAATPPFRKDGSEIFLWKKAEQLSATSVENAGIVFNYLNETIHPVAVNNGRKVSKKDVDLVQGRLRLAA